MTLIKICGVTNIKDAMMIASLGADAIGFVFAQSKRRITPQRAKNIIDNLSPFLTTVGVFMDTTLEEINQIAEFTGIDIVQLHGHEPPEYCRKIKKRIIKRIPILDNDDTDTLAIRMKRFQVAAYLLDPGTGSGKTFRWEIASGINLPIIVAGGLTPNNVKEVIKLLHPYAVDVSSGVEHSVGKKDERKVKEFIAQVRTA
jgi:phosphoribosylanthranilate isomerase